MRAPFFPSPRISSPPPLFALVLHLPESLFRVVIKSPFDSTIVRFLGDACSREGHALRNGDRMQIRPGHRKTLLKFCLYAVIMPTYDACDRSRTWLACFAKGGWPRNCCAFGHARCSRYAATTDVRQDLLLGWPFLHSYLLRECFTAYSIHNTATICQREPFHYPIRLFLKSHLRSDNSFSQ